MQDLSRLNNSLNSIRHQFILTEELLSELLNKYKANDIISILHILLDGKTSRNHSKEELCQRFEFGGIFINGIACQQNIEITKPVRIEFFELPFKTDEAPSFFPEFSADWIIYQDNFYSICYKPHKLPTLPTREQKIYNLKDYLNVFFNRSVHLPSRLDTSTKGILLVSINETTHIKFQQMFEKRELEKSYLLKTKIEPSWDKICVEQPIGKDDVHPILRKVNGRDPKAAITNFENLGSGLILATPKTGRTHQIRVHANYLNCPILGDNFYNGESAEELHLLSYRLKFIHPITGQEMIHQIPQVLMPQWVDDLKLIRTL